MPNLPNLLHPASTAAATATATASLGLTAGDTAGEAGRPPNITRAAAAPERACEATSFADFCAPRLGPSQPVTAALASARLGQAWAQAVLMHWCRLQRQGGIDLSQPLWVLDLAPGDGSLAAHFLPPLWALLQGHGLQAWPLQVLACAAHPEQLQRLRSDWSQHPALDDHVQAGRLKAAIWPARTGAPLLLGDARAPLFGVRNPLVALALGGWSSQPAQWHGVHQGQCYSAAVQATGSEVLALSCDWQPAIAPHRLLTHYAATIPEAPLLLSEQALGQVDALADFSAGRYLLLAADMGVSTERQIRDQALTPPTHWQPGEQWLPVNFHALARHELAGGADVVQQQCRDDGWVLHLSCRDDALGSDAASWQGLTQCVLQAQPDDAAMDDDGGEDGVDDNRADSDADGLSDVGAVPFSAPTDAALLAQQLRHSADAVAGLTHLLRDLDLARLVHDPLSAAALCRALMQAWAQTPRPQRAVALGLALGQVLVHVGAWGAARQVLAQCRAEGPAAQARLALWQVNVERSTGQTGAALRLNLLAQAASANLADLKAQAAELRLRLNEWLGSAWYFHEHMHAGDLCLELLGAEHAHGLRQQLRDPQIADMAQLPMQGEMLGQGLSQRRSPDAHSVEYALLHREHGLVGGIGFCHHADMAFFHFWIGTDFQGHGLALPALRLLMQVLPRAGVGQLFSAVYADNWRCRQVLARAGFARLAAPPGDACERSVWMHRSLDECAPAQSTAEIERRCQVLYAHLPAEPEPNPEPDPTSPMPTSSTPTGNP